MDVDGGRFGKGLCFRGNEGSVIQFVEVRQGSDAIKSRALCEGVFTVIWKSWLFPRVRTSFQARR